MKRWLVRLVLKPLKAFVMDVVRCLLIEGSNYLIEGEFSRNLSSRLNIPDERIDTIIREFTDGVVEYAERNLDRVFEGMLRAKGVDGV